MEAQYPSLLLARNPSKSMATEPEQAKPCKTFNRPSRTPLAHPRRDLPSHRGIPQTHGLDSSPFDDHRKRSSCNIAVNQPN